MLVVDCDTDNEETATYVKQRFGASTVQVKTPRGRHYYYRLDGVPVPTRVREPDISIDFKSGADSYVVGPGSIRPDGGEYVEDVGVLCNASSLPVFVDHRPDLMRSSPTRVSVGNRTDYLWIRAREFVETCDSKEELFAELQAVRDWDFEFPETYGDAEIWKATNWGWKKRLSNDLWGGAKSVVQTGHREFELLMEGKDGELAHALLHVLRHNHSGGEKSGKLFCICRMAMAEAKVIPGWNQNHYRRARDALLKAGLIVCIRRGNRFIGPSQYMFSTPRIDGGEGFILHTGGSSTPKTEGSI